MIASTLPKPASVRDPVARARRTTVICGVLCGVVVGLATTWSLWPLDVQSERRDAEALDARASSAQSTPKVEPFNLVAFEAPLWTAPPQVRTIATSSTPPPPPPPPLKLQLLGIFQVEKSDSASSYRALLYDPDQDKVVIVASGDSIAQRTVDSIDRSSIALRDTAGVRTIALRPDQSATVPLTPTEVRR